MHLCKFIRQKARKSVIRQFHTYVYTTLCPLPSNYSIKQQISIHFNLNYFAQRLHDYIHIHMEICIFVTMHIYIRVYRESAVVYSSLHNEFKLTIIKMHIHTNL